MIGQPKPVKQILTKKLCDTCQKVRDIRFFSSKRAKTCGECKQRKWRTAWKNRPAAKHKQADEAWSKAVKDRDGWKCVYCGKTSNLNSHHIFSRNHKGLRWDLDNGICLCAGCHSMSSIFSAHLTPCEFVEFIKARNGIEWYEELRRKAKAVYSSPITSK